MDHSDFQTKAIRNSLDKTHNKEHSSPLYLTSSFVFDDAEHARALFSNEQEGYAYSRYSNPNLTELIGKMTVLEGGESGLVTGSGMSAMMLSMLSFLKAGDHLITSRALFASTHQLLTKLFPRWQIEHSYADLTKIENLERCKKANTRLVFIETPSNPGLEILDLELIADFCRTNQIIFIVDNCFATPYLQKPIDFGADLVAHSATKFIDGQGRVLGGVLVGKAQLIEEATFLAKHMGTALSPFNAWILSKSLETLGIRMEKHCQNALKLAQYLEQHQDILEVGYPFLESHPQYNLAKKQMNMGGAVVNFKLHGGQKRCLAFHDHLQMLSKSSNLGDTRTIITYPSFTTHSSLTEEERLMINITDDLLRISVGLESIDDILKDIEQAINQSR